MAEAYFLSSPRLTQNTGVSIIGLPIKRDLSLLVPIPRYRYQKRARQLAAGNTFETIAREWFQKNSTQWVESHSGRILSRLEKDVFPYIGKRPITELSAPEILEVVQRIESRGAIETAHRTHQNIGQIFLYAIASGYAEIIPHLTFVAH